jgi:hypothetical protein
LNEYFLVSVDQHIERARQLLREVENQATEADFDLLAQRCKNQINDAIRELKALQNDPKMLLPQHQSIRLRRFRRATAKIGDVETIGVAALSRKKPIDLFLNRLIREIKREIRYPLLPPIVTALSGGYFYIIQEFNLMFVPPWEANYLLHLPDLYHELAHPLLYEERDPLFKPIQAYEEIHPQVEPFQICVNRALALAIEYVLEETDREERQSGHSPEHFLFYLHLWQHSWWKWIVEFFCDLYATFTLGPAYAWSNVHLCMKLGSDPFQVPTHNAVSHPADDARMRVMLKGLSLIGFTEETEEIEKRWREYLMMSGAKPEAVYARCYPDNLLDDIAGLGYEGVKNMGCRIAHRDLTDPIHCALNNAWHEFWQNPRNYVQWEKQKIEELHQHCGVTV